MTCGQCLLPTLHPQKLCPIFNEPVDVHAQACKKCQTELHFCENCGNLLLELGILFTHKGGYIEICNDCKRQRGTCKSCIELDTCDFETNPSSLPKYVMKEIRQGNMIAQQQIPNPERIRQTCQNGCKCWDEELGCLKQNGCCGSWKGRF